MTGKPKKSKRFKGTSKKGNFQEALTNAVNAARAGIPSTLITWKLYSVSGEAGGVVGANDLTVTIEATSA